MPLDCLVCFVLCPNKPQKTSSSHPFICKRETGRWRARGRRNLHCVRLTAHLRVSPTTWVVMGDSRWFLWKAWSYLRNFLFPHVRSPEFAPLIVADTFGTSTQQPFVSDGCWYSVERLCNNFFQKKDVLQLPQIFNLVLAVECRSSRRTKISAMFFCFSSQNSCHVKCTNTPLTFRKMDV